VIGDDWHVAAIVVAALGLTALLAHVAGVNAWWLLPLAAFAALGWSLRRWQKRIFPLVRPIPEAQSAQAVFPRGTAADRFACGVPARRACEFLSNPLGKDASVCAIRKSQNPILHA